jgi:thiamine-phosphate pyrophosphorylase
LASPLPPRPFVYPILDVALLAGRSVGGSVKDLALGGATIVQLRAKAVDDRRYLALAQEARDAARAAGVLFLVNDRPDIACLVGADGVHVGQADLPARCVRALLPEGAIVGVSTHGFEQAVRAASEPVDYVAVGPIFPTRTKARADPVVGLELIRRLRATIRLPLVAIGGITRSNAGAVAEAGADGLAVVSDLLAAGDLVAATAELRAALIATR